MHYTPNARLLLQTASADFLPIFFSASELHPKRPTRLYGGRAHNSTPRLGTDAVSFETTVLPPRHRVGPTKGKAITSPSFLPQNYWPHRVRSCVVTVGYVLGNCVILR